MKKYSTETRAFIYFLIYIGVGYVLQLLGMRLMCFFIGVGIYYLILISLDIKSLLFHKKGIVHYEQKISP